MQHLTIRNVPPELAKALEEEKKRRGLSLNQTVIQLLSQATGVASYGKHHNGGLGWNLVGSGIPTL